MECNHSKFVNVKSNKYAICEKCSTLLKLLKDSVIPVIKDNTHTYSDLPTFEIFNNMKKQSELIKLKKVSERYLNIRKEILDYMKHLNSKFKYSDITYYLGVYLIDLIAQNENIIHNYSFDLIAISCLILSCNSF